MSSFLIETILISQETCPASRSTDELAIRDTILGEDRTNLVERDRLDRPTVRSHSRGGEEGVVDRFFSRLDGRLEEAGHVVVAELLHRQPSRIERPPDLGVRRERHDVIARSVGRGRSRPAEAHDRASGEPSKVTVGERRIGRDDHDDRSIAALSWRLYVALERVLTQLASHGRTNDLKDAAEVALHENTNSPAAKTTGQHTRRRADPALPTECHRPRTSADASFGYCPTLRRGERFAYVLRRDRPRANGVQGAVVRLGHKGIDRSHVLHARLLEHPAHQGIGGAPDTERAREENGRLQLTELRELRGAEELSEAVSDMQRRGDAVEKEIALVRQDRGDAGANGVALVHGRVPYPHARNVGDGVVRPWCEDTRLHAEIARAGPLRLYGRTEGNQQQQAQ